METGHSRKGACRCYCFLFGVLVLWATPAAAMFLDSSSALYEDFFWIGFSDPPPRQGVIGVRTLNGFGTVASSIQYDQPTNGNGPFTYQAQSSISADPTTGISFGGLASVSSLPSFSGLDGRAHTEGAFVDEVLISAAPALNNTLAFLSIPLHVTGAVDTVGADLNAPFAFVHDGKLSYQFCVNSCQEGTVEFSTPGETIPGPVQLDQTVAVEVPFFLGQSFFLSALFAVDAELGVPFDTTPGAAAPGSLTVADFSHTLILEAATVVDGSGAPIPDAVVSSDFDFLAGPSAPPPSNGIPEPPTGLLLIAGLIVWAARPRHRHGRLHACRPASTF